MIITDISKLNIIKLKEKCEPVSSIEEGEEIGAKLLKELSKSQNGIGLAANQIGINKRVCVINVKEPIVLINPEIIESSEEWFIFPEGCLSFPNYKVRVRRHVSVKVKADNHDSTLDFTAESKDYKNAFECACVQHEIDHLDGITMFDREFKQEPYKAPKKYGRNEKVTITNDNETKILKYKKAEPLLKKGWKVSDIQINAYD